MTRLIGFASLVVCLVLCSCGPQTGTEENACILDARKFCADVKPGEGRITECLRQHKKQLSADCRVLLGLVTS